MRVNTCKMSRIRSDNDNAENMNDEIIRVASISSDSEERVIHINKEIKI